MESIKDLLPLTPITAHWMSSKPLDNEFATMVQGTAFYTETRYVKPEWWTKHENKLAYLIKFHNKCAVVFKESAIEKHGKEVVDNAYRYMTNIANRSNIQPVSLQYAAIAWFIDQMVDIDKTKELHQWKWEVKEVKK